MPKVPMDYSKCCIYKIEHNDDESLVYVGHTTNFDKRKTQHKINCYNDKQKPYNSKVYQMIRENGGWEMFKMIEVEKYPCNDRREAERRENEVIKELRASMNTNNSFRTKEELTEYHTNYYEANKQKIQEYQKKYQKNNKPKIQEYNKEYNETNKPKIQEYHKEFYEANKQKIQERSKEYYEANNKKYHKEYYEANKQKIQERSKEYYEANNVKVKCECGCEIIKSKLKQHQATKQHLEKMKNI